MMDISIDVYDPVLHGHFEIVVLEYSDGKTEFVRGGNIMAQIVGKHAPAGVAPEELRISVDSSSESDLALVAKHFPDAEGHEAAD